MLDIGVVLRAIRQFLQMDQVGDRRHLASDPDPIHNTGLTR